MSEAVKQNKELDKPIVMLPKGKKLLFVAILYAMFIFDFVIRYGVNGILPLIQEDLKLSSTQVGLLGSAIFLGMAIFVMPISFIGENKSQRRAISLCGILWSGATMACGMAGSAIMLIVSRFIVGAGNSAYAPLSTAMLTTWYKKSSWGKLLGSYNTAMSIGGALGAVVFAALGSAFGWRSAFYIIGGVSLVVSLLSLLLPDNKKLMAEQGVGKKEDGAKEEVAQVKLNAKDTAKLVLNNRALLTMCLAAGIATFTVNIVATFVAIYYVNVKGLGVTAAAGIMAIGTPLNLIAFPLGGAILDKWYKKDRRARMWLPMITVVCAGIVRAIGFSSACIPIILIGGAIYSMGNTSFHTASHELVPVWYKSVSYGTYVLCIQLLGALGPVVGGMVVDAVGIQMGLVYVQIGMLVSSLLLIYAGKIYLKYYNAARQAEKEKGIGVEPAQA